MSEINVTYINSNSLDFVKNTKEIAIFIELFKELLKYSFNKKEN